MNILVVDDETSVCEAIANILESEDTNLLFAASGK